MTQRSLANVLEAHRLPFTLRVDQVDSCEKLSEWPRAGLYAEVGTGKTVMATVLSLMWNNEVTVVTMPPILLKSWQRWLLTIENIGSVVVYRGDPRERAAMNIRHARWLLMSQQIFKKDFARLVKELGKVPRTLIVDEAHCIKNPASQNFKLTKEFADGECLALLTGTPLSTPHDAYAYVKLVSPEIYRSKQQFENLHIEDRDFYGNVTAWKNLDLMHQNLMMHSVRLLKEHVLKDLKKPNYIPIEYELDREHKMLYDMLAEEQLLELETGGKIDATSAVKLYNALQQVVVNWDYFSGNEDARSTAFDIIDMVMDQAEVMDPKNSKLIIFTYFKMTSRKVLEYLKEFGAVGCYSEIGDTAKERNLERFMFDPTCRIMVAQPMSGGVGFNPQAVCSEVLFLESPSIPWHFVQGAGRVYRDGQPNVPNIHIAVASGTIQNRLHQRMLATDALVNQVQGGFKDLRDAIYGN
jgi:superfamily II DNA or RNA helicase